MKRLILIIALFTSFGVNATQKESDYTNQMANYATIIGRAAACGADPSDALSRVGSWMDDWFDKLNLSSTMRSTYLNIFMQGTEHHLHQQQQGTSPDSCGSVLSTFNSIF